MAIETPKQAVKSLTQDKISTTLSATLTAAPTAGNLLIAVISGDKLLTSPVAPSGFTLGPSWAGTAGTGLAWAYKLSASGTESVVSWSWSNQTGAAMAVLEFPVVSAAYVTAIVNGTESAVSTLSVSSAATSSAGLRLAFAAIDTAGTGTSPASWPTEGPTWSGVTSTFNAIGQTAAPDNGGSSLSVAAGPAVANTAQTVTMSYSGQADQNALIVPTFTGTERGAAVASGAAPTSGLVGRFRADTIAVANGASVTTWSDSVGSRIVTTRTAAPTFVSSGAAGSKPAVRFNGTNQSLGMSSPPTVNQPHSVVAIAASAVTTSGADRQIIWQGSGGEVQATAAGKWQNFAGAARASTQNVTTSPTIITSNFNGANSDSQMFVNGALGVTANVGTGAMNQGLLLIGENSGRWWNGDIYEILIYDHTLTTAERAQVHSYAQDRYGIAVADYTTSDSTAPTVPSNVTAIANSPTQVTVSWTASTDAVGVASYRVIRNGATIAAAVTGATSFVDTSVAGNTSYIYTVSAADAAGNRSSESSVATVTTPIAPDSKVRFNNVWVDMATRTRVNNAWSIGAATRLALPTPSVVYPQSFGTLSTKPAWTNSAAAAGPLDQSAFTPTRTLTLPNIPASGGDLTSAWVAYFGNRSGVAGTKQAGDRVIIPAGIYYYNDNLDIPDSNNNIELVLGDATGRTTLRSAQMSSGLVDRHAIRVIGADNIRIRGYSKDNYATIETQGVVGRTGLNQQGNTMLLLDPGTDGFKGQDLVLRGARGAGFCAYNASNYWLNRITVENSLADGYHNTNGSSYGLFTDCVSRRAGDDGWAAVYYDGDNIASQSHHMEVYRFQVDTNGHGRGFANICCTDIVADQVIVTGSAAAGVIVDREASTRTDGHGSISNVLYQRFLVQGCNWSEQDHGAIFLRNGITNGTVTGVVMESFELKDAAPNRQVIRTIGDGTANTVLEVTLKDFKFSGGTTTTAGDQFGGNSTSRITRTNHFNADIVAGQDTIVPTLVINTPGAYATVTGSMTGSTTTTENMRNTQAIQFYAGDAGAKVSGNNVVGIVNVEVKVGNTVIGTVAASSLDSAKRGSQAWDTTQFQNGPAVITLKTTDQKGLTKTLTRDVTISNTTPGTTSGIPT